ncbi:MULTISPECIES: winged helix-turn-helix transcriptional regulator [Staphylococcus]|uniref:Transcriptional regulator, HxlR family n=2 Tax=Staphylococcus TaxID=1279 RepID=A0ABY1H3E0_9STAP|nr:MULTISPECIES: helix-turn-helix domain-containing protein [Staphylococcus]ATH62654.1 transcriptional regulator [Staphylococcus pasteuri]KKI57358.1 Transcriptional regulator, HxlR family [Staphylococcus pasteuri]MBL3397822.1 helix-turn-helix transcriptional regulator [Staphylococcus pasteuri]MBM6507319.1 helix-turn-helix transcriptional regulator [Staphylococcus pasteuri]MCD9067204.1 helix-turn-helix transcriptional regulator [Staphylococcus pasteuri]
MTHKTYNCPVEAVISLIGGKYKPIILWYLLNNTLRFNEIQRLLPQASPKMLSQQLKELQKEGFIEKVIYPEVPPKTEYYMTDYGKTLEHILNEMCNWGEEFMGDYIVKPTDS